VSAPATHCGPCVEDTPTLMTPKTPDPTITVKCPKCAHEFPLSEAVLGSVRDDIIKEVSVDVAKRELALETKVAAVRTREEQIRKQAAEVDEEVKKQLAARMGAVEGKARRQAEEALALKMKGLEDEVAEKTKALKSAEKNELDLRRDQRRLAEEREKFELEAERKLQAEREKVRHQITEQVTEQNRLKLAEREKVITDLKNEMEALQRKAEQGSQQAQGEVLELDFAAALRASYPSDQVAEVAKGIRGADVVQTVISPTGRRCGVILYEAKRTKNWGADWTAKLKSDMIEAKANIGVIVTEVLPAEMKRFGLIDGVWVTDRVSAIPLAHSLRWSLSQLAIAKMGQEGAKEKMEILYGYLTGSEFRQRVEAVIEAFTSMKEDLEAEKRAILKHWAKREKQLSRVVDNMASMYGDIQGLSGNALQAIPSLELTG
jgi:hypothetical protein